MLDVVDVDVGVDVFGLGVVVVHDCCSCCDRCCSLCRRYFDSLQLKALPQGFIRVWGFAWA